MVLGFKSPFIKLEDKEKDQEENMDNKAAYAGHKSSDKMTSSAVGLRILIQISRDESNILVKSALRSQPTSQSHHLRTKPPESCFLKTCQLCNKKLSLDKDVYMYRYHFCIYVSQLGFKPKNKEIQFIIELFI